MARYLFITLLVFTGCAPLYIPNVRNSPMFTKGGEYQASVQIGNGIEAQTAFAVSDRFGLMTNFSYINQSDSDEIDDYHRHQFLEGGLGYFVNREDSFFEVYAGYGRGKGSNYQAYETFFGPGAFAATGKYERYFIQPAFGVNKGEMNLSFAPRVSMVDFFEFAGETVSIDINREAKFFFEPAIIGRANFLNNNMFATFQAGVSLGLSQDIYFDRRTFQLSGGIGLRLGAAKKLVNRL